MSGSFFLNSYYFANQGAVSDKYKQAYNCSKFLEILLSFIFFDFSNTS
tara:strand:+ start:681 stop:824 length:144 start_codon:yes stop_codon:yes gene_type:complete